MATNTPTQPDYIPFTLPFKWGQIGRWVGAFVAIVFLLWMGDRIGDDPRGLIQATISGLLVGGVYALVAVGIVMINKASGIFNFAHGAMMLITALIFYSFFTTPAESLNPIPIALLAVGAAVLFTGMNSWRNLLDPVSVGIGVVMAVVLFIGMTIGGSDLRMVRSLIGGVTAAVFIGLAIERFSIRPLVGQPIFTLILMTLALERVFAGLSLMVWGSIDKTLTAFSGVLDQPNTENPAWKLPGIIRVDTSTIVESRITTVNIDSRLVIAFGIALIVFLIFVLFFQYTNVGLAMRATSENQRLAQSVGMRVRAILAAAWAIATLLALAAGVLYGASSNIGIGMPLIAIQVFPAVLLGGLESIGGALVGGIVIRLAQTWADTIFGMDAGTQLAPYVILMIVLVIRPDGLFGLKRIERI